MTAIEGVGEVYSVPFHPDVVAKMIEDVCERIVVGRDPFDIETLWRIVYSSGYTQRPDTSLLGVLSGIETACWDIVGKAVREADLQAARRAGPREAALLHLYLSRALGPHQRLCRPRARCDARCRSTSSRASPRSSSTRWARIRRSMRGSSRSRRSTIPSGSSGSCARRSAAAAICCSARTAR